MAEAITFFSKNSITCPVCSTEFRREDLLSGRGRLNADKLTDELRRKYFTTQKFGNINPLIYPVTVCPNCLYATEKDDFLTLPQNSISRVRDFQDVRAKYLISIFNHVPDFNENRTLQSGVASYILAISCYPFFNFKKQSPTAKMGIFSLRTAWLMNDLFEEEKDVKYRELSEVFYKKATEFYISALERQSKAIEPMDAVKNLGPDIDKNFGYDGFLYVTAILRYKTTAFIQDPYEKLKVYEEVKRLLSKVFGVGKKARNKPEDLLNLAKDVYDKIGESMDEIKTSLEISESE